MIKIKLFLKVVMVSNFVMFVKYDLSTFSKEKSTKFSFENVDKSYYTNFTKFDTMPTFKQ